MIAPTCDVHLLWLDPVPDDRAGAARALLSPAERARLDRLAAPALAAEFLWGRALARSVLARRSARPPAALRFEHGPNGRPSLAGGGPSFNLSHARGLIALAVAESGEVGVDVETEARRTDTAAIAHRYFSARELRSFAGLDRAARRHRFFELWTLKEAYLKALGIGIGVPLASFSIVPAGERRGARGSHALRREAPHPKHGPLRPWWFDHRRVGAHHHLALALALTIEASPRLRITTVTAGELV